MKLPTIFRRKAVEATPGALEAIRFGFNPYIRLGGTNTSISVAYERGLAATYGWIYSNQPAVRAVVDLIARNVAQLPLKLYERVSDVDRERAYDHPACLTMDQPDPETPGPTWVYRFVTDYLTFENAFAVKFPGPSNTRILYRIPPERVTVAGGYFSPTGYRVWRDDGTFLPVPVEAMIHWYGYNPNDPLLGLSKLETLREELANQAVLSKSISELAKTGFRSGYIKRPIDAADWSPEARERFREAWENAKASGRTPVLEEGMEFEKESMTPEDAEVLNTRRFTVEEVARLYGPALSILGLSTADPAEGRKALYADVLPPYAKGLASQLDVDLLGTEYGDDQTYYFEFDLNEKLRGDLESRFSQLTASTGAPWLTRNEARTKENLPPIDGGDELVVPMNVIADGAGPTSPTLPAPNVMPPQDPNGPPADGSHRTGGASIDLYDGAGNLVRRGSKAVPGAVDPDNRISQVVPRRRADMARQRRNASDLQAIIYREFDRQSRSLASKADAPYDVERWTSELEAAIGPKIREMVGREGDILVARLGGADFDEREVANYLDAMVAGTASGLIEATRRDVEKLGATDALDRAKNQRAAVAGAQIASRATYFGRTEGAKQAPGVRERQQTWVADTDRHADLDGAAVALGADWGGITPGSEPNCGCGVDIT